MIALDLSRLLARAGSATPSGIDRVELAYARHLLGGDRSHCFTAFASFCPFGSIGLVPRPGVEEFVMALGAAWHDGADPDERRRLASLARRLRRDAMFGDRALHQELRLDRDRPVYLLVSHHHLDRRRVIARFKTRSGGRFVCFIHDLIPLELPQCTRAAQTRRHRHRIATAAALADTVIVNSAATRAALLPWFAGDRASCITAAPLGCDLLGFDLPISATAAAVGRPYFVCLGTIDGRKNQRLLLNLWRGFAPDLGTNAPRLLLVGQRGWGADPLVRRLPELSGIVERPAVPDRAMAALLRGARALLLPSLAEGFGLPVIEALALGVPVLCSDLSALRESGGGVPEYLDPDDLPAWRAAVCDYAGCTPRREAQLARLAGWQAPRWSDHFAIVDRVLDGVT